MVYHSCDIYVYLVMRNFFFWPAALGTTCGKRPRGTEWFGRHHDGTPAQVETKLNVPARPATLKISVGVTLRERNT